MGAKMSPGSPPVYSSHLFRIPGPLLSGRRPGYSSRSAPFAYQPSRVAARGRGARPRRRAPLGPGSTEAKAPAHDRRQGLRQQAQALPCLSLRRLHADHASAVLKALVELEHRRGDPPSRRLLAWPHSGFRAHGCLEGPLRVVEDDCAVATRLAPDCARNPACHQPT